MPSVRTLLLLAVMSFMVAACGTSRIVGNYYLRTDDYSKGAAHFRKQVAENPRSAMANYYLGRMLLAQNKAGEALPYLEQAASLDSGEEEHWFWLGVARWADGDMQGEREAYQKALAIDPKFFPARLYLAHNYKNAGRFDEALPHYDKVLVEAPLHPDALFNRADILQNTGKRGLAVPAWKKYLDNYPDGSWAREASLALNGLGDFTYRIHVIGVRQILLQKIALDSASPRKLTKESKESTDVVASMLKDDPDLQVEIASYDDAGESAARDRAEVVRNELLKNGARPGQVDIAVYGRPEIIRAGGEIHTLDDSVVFRNPRP
ncbi:tetratricopeptide repeat protein [Oceanidesulfovibrio indonesiensis]|nr:tetratricopeptide repeat protein [Oceanidesulfovibrio indonesiensis]